MHTTAGGTGSVRWMAAVAMMVAFIGGSRLARAEGIKIGYFDVKQILAEADQATEIKKRLQEDFKGKQEKLDKKKAEIEQLQEDLQSKQSVLSPSALSQMQNDLQMKAQEAQKLFQDLQIDLNNKEQQALSELMAQLAPVVQEIAQSEGYKYIFEKNEAGLFYAPDEDDLTAQLLRKLNQKYHGGGGKKKGHGK